MNRPLVDQIVSAVLYEGYILYPYRPALKNRQRWSFGGLYPRAYSQSHPGADDWKMQTQCLLHATGDAVLDVTVRFLHLTDRRVGRLDCPLNDLADHEQPPLEFVESLQIGETCYQAWQEAVERQFAIEGLKLQDLAGRPRQRGFQFPGQTTREALRSSGGPIEGLMIRHQQPIAGSVMILAEPIESQLWKITVRIANDAALEDADGATRDEALMRSLVSTHTILAVRQGAFVSLIDPPPRWTAAAADCRNEGAWPVLVGQQGEQDTMLSSPIILYDYPQVAPESLGPLFDSTEIDELLTLRILTLTDDEKRAMAGGDPEASGMLKRAEAATRQELLGLHGAVHDIHTGRRTEFIPFQAENETESPRLQAEEAAE